MDKPVNIEQPRMETFTLRTILKDEYDLMLKTASGATMYGIPLPEMSKEDLLVVYAFVNKQKDAAKRRQADRLRFESELQRTQ